MNKIRILAVEDNLLHQEKIRIVVEEMGYELAALANNATDAMGLLYAVKPDILLLDISINGNIDGIELAKRINEHQATPIIFVTSHTESEYLQRSVAVNPYAYIIKPIEKAKLQPAIELALHRFQLEQEVEQNGAELLPFHDRDMLLSDSLFTKQGSYIVKLPFADILYMETAQEHYCSIYTRQDVFKVRLYLKDLAAKLPMRLFAQIQRSIIINTSYITRFDDSDHLVFLGKKALPISRRYQKDLFNRLNLI